jgi:hypothetical protein
MEIQGIFSFLSVLMFFNLLQLSQDFVTVHDYCQERYLHRLEEFSVVLFQANLRKLGYNGRTIQRDMVLIFIAAAIRRCIVLFLWFGQPGKKEDSIQLMFHIFNTFLSAGFLKYRAEYFAPHRVILETLFILGSHPDRHMTRLITIFLALNVVGENLYRYWCGRWMATKEASRFQKAWLECSQKNPGGVTKLTRLCKSITARLDTQRAEALHMLCWWERAQAFLEERVGRWSLLSKGKARQKSTDLDLLMKNAGQINEAFLELVCEISFNGCAVNHNTGLEFVAGPVKQSTRTLQKLVRRYRRDVGCLTDLVRCSVIADDLENVENFLRLLCSRCLVGLGDSFEETGEDSRQRLSQRLWEQEDTGDEVFRITALENRFDPSYDYLASMGYRDLALNVEVGWIMQKGMVSIQKVRDWRPLNCITHICEIQVRTRSFHNCAVAGEYFTLRDGFSM